MRSLIGSSTEKRPYGVKHIRKDFLPIFDGEVLRLTSHGNSFPHSSFVLGRYQQDRRQLYGS